MIYAIGLFILDTDNKQLFLSSDSKEISNHSRTIQLLGLLVQAYPKFVSKDVLLQALWGDEDVTDWVLSRQVYKLRQLLSAYDPDTSYIKTVHTKGFTLDVEPRVLDKPQQLTPDKLPQNPPVSAENAKTKSRWLTWVIAAACVLLGVIGYTKLKPVPKTFGELSPQSSTQLPLNANWSSSKPDAIHPVSEGLFIRHTGNDPLYTSTILRGPAFYQGAIFSMRLKVDQALVENKDKGLLRLFYQTYLDGGPGEWDCFIDPKMIQTLEFEHHCLFDENGAYTKSLDREPVNLGLKVDGYQSGGITITSANVKFPASISTDKGWTTTDNLPLEYNRGVSFRPKSLANQLMTTIKGPSNVSGSKIAFTIELDDLYINSNSGIQLFFFNKNREWKDCFVEGKNIHSNVFTKTCQFGNSQNPFVLKEGESVQIGLRIYGSIKNREIKILGITISE
jgi:DNA-binding winged helix-turn-helix (wHTH) protein